jgi:hypothetical protein
MSTATLRISTPLPQARTAPKKKGLFARALDAMIEARMRQAMREIAYHRHLLPENLLEDAGRKATVRDDSTLPFTR